MKKIALAIVLCGGCEHAAEYASEHLKVLGYQDVSCVQETRGTAFCTTASGRFRCVIYDAPGCSNGHAAACELYATERPVSP
jgi:hypothetical protein